MRTHFRTMNHVRTLPFGRAAWTGWAKKMGGGYSPICPAHPHALYIDTCERRMCMNRNTFFSVGIASNSCPLNSASQSLVRTVRTVHTPMYGSLLRKFSRPPPPSCRFHPSGLAAWARHERAWAGNAERGREGERQGRLTRATAAATTGSHVHVLEG